MHQLISEPTHFMDDSKSCIDVIFTDQHNLFLEPGVQPSLNEQCRHQIVNSIFQAFDCNPTLNVRSVYLDISKAFDRVWHEGLVYKLR